MIDGRHKAILPEHVWGDGDAEGVRQRAAEEVGRALNRIGYDGPLSVEWEDGAMDREHGEVKAAAFVRRLDFPPSDIVFDAQFARDQQHSG